MRTQNVIIITSGCSAVAHTNQLDHAITSVLEMKKNPIVVVGPEGDDFLRACTLIEDCDLVFDPNYDGGFFSGLKAGLYATRGATFAFSINRGCPDKSEFHRLENAFGASAYFATDNSVPDCVYSKLAPEQLTQIADFGSSALFFITAKGVHNLLELPSATTWTPTLCLDVAQLVLETANEATAKSANSDFSNDL